MADTLTEVRAAIQRNQAHVVDVLVENCHHSRYLENLIRIVVARRQGWDTMVHDATIGRRSVQIGVSRVRTLVRGFLRVGLQRFRFPGKFPVRRVDDDRCSNLSIDNCI